MTEKKDLMSRLKDFEVKELESNELVQTILENESKRFLTYDLAGVPVKVAFAFPREVRYFYEQNRNRTDKDKLKFSDIELDAYTIASKLCLEPPFNDPKFWEYYDTKTGKFWGVFNSIYAGIEKNEEKIGDFRKK